MSKFRKDGKRATPGISTASLPDIVFMLLFFFMVATVVKESDPKVRFTIPNTNYTKLIEDRSKIGFIYVGKPLDEDGMGQGTKFELNGKIIGSVNGLRSQIREKYGKLSPQEKADFWFSLKIDGATTMFDVKKVKSALQEEGALKIIYASKQIED